MKSVTTVVRHGALLGLALLLCATGASAQMYKWVDANGKTHFTDQPPPANAKPSALKGAVSTATADMPYALATAMRNYPVTLYTTSPCAACDQGRSYLKGRGIPFNEITVSTAEDEARLRAAGGDGGLPFFIVGRSKFAGYQETNWDSMLNVALDPAKKMLPSTYQYPSAGAAAPVAQPATADPDAVNVAAAEEAERERRRRDAAKPKSDAPPGFRF